MDRVKLYREVNNFYQIRGDNFARNYIMVFVKMVLNQKIPLKNLKEWFLNNKSNIKFDFRGKNKDEYEIVLHQFIRYINAVYGISEINVKNNKRKTKIHKTYYDLKKSM